LLFVKSTQSLNKLWSKGGLWLLFSLAGLPLITLSHTASAWMEIPPVLALSFESIAEEFGVEHTETKTEMALNGVSTSPAESTKSKKAGKDSSKKDDLLYPVKDNKGREDSKYKNNIDLNDPSVKTYVEYNTETKMYEE